MQMRPKKYATVAKVMLWALLLTVALFFVSAVHGCVGSFYSAKAYLAENMPAMISAGATCTLDKPDEYTISFGWTFRRDPVTGQYNEQSLSYVTVGLICKDFTDESGNALGIPKISHTTVTCDVTKLPSEGPCGNLVRWGIIETVASIIDDRTRDNSGNNMVSRECRIDDGRMSCRSTARIRS
jgi:hypothetical protein